MSCFHLMLKYEMSISILVFIKEGGDDTNIYLYFSFLFCLFKISRQIYHVLQTSLFHYAIFSLAAAAVAAVATSISTPPASCLLLLYSSNEYFVEKGIVTSFHPSRAP